jgi:hypothetical protein
MLVVVAVLFGLANEVIWLGWQIEGSLLMSMLLEKARTLTLLLLSFLIRSQKTSCTAMQRPMCTESFEQEHGQYPPWYKGTCAVDTMLEMLVRQNVSR